MGLLSGEDEGGGSIPMPMGIATLLTLLAALMLYLHHQSGHRTNQWRAGNAVVERIEAKEFPAADTGTYTSIGIVYTYAVNGQSFVGDVYSFPTPIPLDPPQVQRVLSEIKPGDTIQIYYNPSDREQATVIFWRDWFERWYGVLGISALILGALTWAWIGIRADTQRRSRRRRPTGPTRPLRLPPFNRAGTTRPFPFPPCPFPRHLPGALCLPLYMLWVTTLGRGPLIFSGYTDP